MRGLPKDIVLSLILEEEQNLAIRKYLGGKIQGL